MSYEVLARQWRPHTFEAVVGQTRATRALAHALDAGRLHHAILFSGTRGVGKTTLARIVAKAMNCETGVTARPCGACPTCRDIDDGRCVDIVEVDAASRTGVEDMRALLDEVRVAPAQARFKVYLVDEAHMLSEKSCNALLKTLEEPPDHVKFLLATTDPKALPITVLSRCLKLALRPLGPDLIASHLAERLGADRMGHEPPALRLIARAAQGSMRDALSLLDQAIGDGTGIVAETEVRAMLGAVDRAEVLDLLETIAARDAPAALARADALTADVADPGSVLSALVDTLHQVALRQLAPAAADPDPAHADARDRVAQRLSPHDVQLCYDVALRGHRDIPRLPEPRLAVEMTVLRMLAFLLDPLGLEAAAPTARAAPKHATAPAAPTRTPTRAPRPTPAPATPAAPIDLTGMTAAGWHALVGELRLTGLAGELAANSTLVRADAGHLTLQLDPALRALHTPATEQRLAEALARRCNASLTLHVARHAPAGPTPAQTRAAARDQRHQAAIDAIEADPVVKALTEVFQIAVDPAHVEPLDEES